ncbi:hypothetical protein POM88_005653 [Heracleum sosnowskyi]|uniref:ClpA/ClpB AAA lid domain-containing protein n=1 Tax=Heracleum sosnowskyi TaxID=360622 RepID=A0AAD8MZB2_9APIA|nr:hypothetical protein POM88_005653 [Heracleum sosnowskyi]
MKQFFFNNSLISSIKTQLFLLNAAYDSWHFLEWGVSDHSRASVYLTCLELGDLLRSVAGPIEADKPLIIELVVAAMEENRQLWIPSTDSGIECLSEDLSEDEYLRNFPRGIGPKPMGKHIEKDSALERRFQPVKVPEPSVDETIQILKGLRERYEIHHKLRYTDEALVSAAQLSYQYISKVASYHQLVSGNSLTKESCVVSEVSYCCSGVKKLSFDESQQASEVKSPSFFKQSGQICPSSVPPFLPSRKAKITGSEPPLILTDYPFTQRFMSSSVRSLELTFKLKSNVSNDKENMEQSANKVEVTEEKPRRDKNEPTL